MAEFLIDANLPYRIAVWQGRDFIHQFNLGDTWTDERIWEYAQANKLTIVTKDADFSNRMMMSKPPPKIIHLKIGNMKLEELETFIFQEWNEIVRLSKSNKLIRVYRDKIEVIS